MVMDDGKTEPSQFPGMSKSAPMSSLEHQSSPQDSLLGGSGQYKSQRLQMSALIPIRTDFESVGVVFIEDIGELHNRDTTLCRHELDQFGAQLGIMIERKSSWAFNPPENDSKVAKAYYQSASYTLEEAPWLRMWHQGRLRSKRETSWFLGLSFGSQQYVMCYCLLDGKDAIREQLGSMIWHHLLVIRALAIASGRQTIEVNELKSEFAGLLDSVPSSIQLDGISLAFTIFDKENETAKSGHFGPARPYVMGSENIVTPYNDIFIHFKNGRDLRYWEVSASLSDLHAYVLSYDTSRLEIDVAPSDSFNAKAATSLTQALNKNDLHNILKTMVVAENLPRYYVAAIMDNKEEQEAFQELDKAQ